MSQARASLPPPDPSLPHDVEAERSVLGGVLLDPDVLHELEGLVAPDDFFNRTHGIIWQAMLDLQTEGRPVDLVTLTARLRETDQLHAVGGIDYLAGLDSGIHSAAHATSYATIVQERSTIRKIVHAAGSIAAEGRGGIADYREFLEEAEQRIFQVTQEQDQRSLVPVKQVALEVFEILQARFQARSDITGISTGYIDLDKMTAGLQRGDLLILAARPSMGKTALALNIAANAALLHEGGAKVAVFSLEMSMQSLVMRMLASEARVRADAMRTGQIRREDWQKLAEAAGRLSEAGLFIDDTPSLPLSQLRSKCRRMKGKHGLDLVLVDYLQLMKGPKSDSREQEISAISRGLKALAKDLDVPVVALSQLNRSLEKRENKRPQLSDLRESGAIEQDADVILFIHREDRYKTNDPGAEKDGLAEVIIAKQRNGATGTVELVFFDEYTRFDNYERSEFDT